MLHFDCKDTKKFEEWCLGCGIIYDSLFAVVSKAHAEQRQITEIQRLAILWCVNLDGGIAR